MAIEVTDQIGGKATLRAWDIKDTPDHAEGIVILVDTKNHNYEFTLDLEQLSALVGIEGRVEPGTSNVQVRLRAARSANR